MAELLRSDSDTDYRYRIMRTDSGFLLSCGQKSEIGLMLGPSEWLYKTLEAAEAGLEYVMLMNAWWTCISKGYPSGDLPERCEAAATKHRDITKKLDDAPLIGQGVTELRKQARP